MKPSDDNGSIPATDEQLADAPLATVTATDAETQATYGLTPGEVSILKSSICVGAPVAWAAFFMAFCKRRNLDPFAKHVYLMGTEKYDKTLGRKVKIWSIVSGIDGLRTIASRNKAWRGQTRPEWIYAEDGTTLVRCEIAVKRAAPAMGGLPGEVMEFWGLADWDEFAQKYEDGNPVGNWKKMPKHMLRVRAEAMALRMAYPEDVGGIYLAEEMVDAERVPQPDQPALEEAERPALQAEAEEIIGHLRWTRAAAMLQRQRFPDDASFLIWLRDEKTRKDGSRRNRTAAQEEPPKLDPKTRAALFAHLNELGIKNKPARLRFALEHGVAVNSYKDLTEEQAHTLLEAAEAIGPFGEVEPLGEPCPACGAKPHESHAEACPEQSPTLL